MSKHELQTIYRVIKDKNNPFVLLNTTALNDDRLSWKAKGIHCYLMKLPDDWRIYQKELVKHSKDGLDSLRSGLNELKKHGYIKAGIKRDETGKFKAHYVMVFETPELASRMNPDFCPEWENPNMDEDSRNNPEWENPVLENPVQENPTLLNKESTKYNTSTKNLCSSRQAAPPNPKREESERIHEWIVQHIPEAKNMDADPIKDWIDSGASFEDDIKPVILKDYKKLQESGEQLGTLHYFDKHILNQVKRRLHPKSKGEAIRQDRVVEAKPLAEPKEVKEFQESDEGLSWRDACGELKRISSLGVPAFISWIDPLDPQSFKDGVVALKAPNKYIADHTRTHFSDIIRDVCQGLNPNVREVIIAV